MPDAHPHMDIDDVAASMRAAYNNHIDPGSKLVPWVNADKDKQEAWRVCAKAAFKAIFGTDYPA